MTDYQKIERMFSQFLDRPSANLTADERAEVKDFIDVGEYGLALETLVAIYLEDEKLPDEDGRMMIDALAAEMSMKPAEIWLPEKE
ncbi:MafI family immunity protein [Taklimakanibacter albus]|uniref:MafI family immunity protein n=1 Tax=Taklimakanibacter albus TaxID=2800327 RepID=A0ACC5RBF6_9HYPH|nr:MafI family immunity protein [Aestuariivirga sp. YIM B02566]MBK1869955.1 MafI family immunity protein [Aestuariivirga sp. YIM B02566]